MFLITFFIGKDNEEISKASQDAENCSENLSYNIENAQSESDEEVKDTINDKNQDILIKYADEPSNIQNVITSNGETTEVTMRRPVRRYSQKTASFRWSGTEMLQIEGPQAVINDLDNRVENSSSIIEETKPDPLESTRINIGYKKTSSLMNEKLALHGFSRSQTFTELPKDGDNCFKALLDQMSQPNQDFKVWEKDDFSFLRWYVIKQLEIHIAAGRSEHYIPQTNNSEDFLEHIQQESSFINNDYIYSISKIFNKDIIIINSGMEDDILYIQGGLNGTKGKGDPLYLAHLQKEDAGQDFYQSIIPAEGSNIENLLKISKGL